MSGDMVEGYEIIKGLEKMNSGNSSLSPSHTHTCVHSLKLFFGERSPNEMDWLQFQRNIKKYFTQYINVSNGPLFEIVTDSSPKRLLTSMVPMMSLCHESKM